MCPENRAKFEKIDGINSESISIGVETMGPSYIPAPNSAMDQNHHASDAVLPNEPSNGLGDRFVAGKPIVSDSNSLSTPFFRQFHPRLTKTNNKCHHLVRVWRMFGLDYSMG